MSWLANIWFRIASARLALAAILVLVALTAASAAPVTFCADPDYLIDTWDTEAGWPASTAYTMAQTPDGFLWLGTLKGLVRFDGVEFTLFCSLQT
jgi:ligand-binding sensor domain-containing protein